ncbi:response regulator [Rugamonas sp. CCM 8940]|uniref:response regulator n=1 Tax=Rugamonas sp. CCM 8940 TaxID=2765359 RepID=UPI0018F781F4|nr:response regulator [Rugamonas sp. CCM 8940]MBJ7309276.1 response regulator [Rugamonas sp. CCM 8940]
MIRLLLVDDEPAVLAALRRSLRLAFDDSALQIETCGDPFAALERVCVCEFDIVLSDFMMPRLTGGALLQALKEVAPDTVRLMLSGSTEFSTAMSAINEAGVLRFIPKPWQAAELEEALRLAMARRAELLAERAERQRRAAEAAAGLSPQEREAARLEREEPGILHVRRAPDGSIIL